METVWCSSRHIHQLKRRNMDPSKVSSLRSAVPRATSRKLRPCCPFPPGPRYSCSSHQEQKTTREAHRASHCTSEGPCCVSPLVLATAIGIGSIIIMALHQHAAPQQQQQDAEAALPPPPDPKDHHHPLLHMHTLPPHRAPAASADRNPAADAANPAGGTTFSLLLTALGFLFLACNSAMAIYRSNGERATVVFVVSSNVDLALLYWCLRRYEVSKPGSVARGRLKVAVWLLTTALTLLFSSKVAAAMPPLVAVVVWLMCFFTVAGGFYGFFCHNADGDTKA
ncbi:hypothetical protein BS78_04G087200 [Paspalum vaginatum]|nr:hypothetical protein BS78_04G087200 [Paspalum vaginatum]